jgi:hypothetical protein
LHNRIRFAFAVLLTWLVCFLFFSFVYRTKEDIAKDAQLYGFCLLGDGATIRGMPLMNVLATVPSGNMVLDIVDCTGHMEDGGRKDATYIASIFNDHIKELDPQGVYLNAIIFDGASNVQKAGQVIQAKYPQVSVLHGIEHCISLFFSDVTKLPVVNAIIENYRCVYRVFGSGSMHSPYAMFRKQAQTFNGGKKIGLLRAADTRMAGYFYALHRMLRLKAPLEATIASAEFAGLKLTNNLLVARVVAFLNDKDMWDGLYCLLRSLFPALRVLRLADRSEPGFDCLFYFLRRSSSAMDWSGAALTASKYLNRMARETDLIEHGWETSRISRSNGGSCPLDDDDNDDELLEMEGSIDPYSDDESVFSNLPKATDKGGRDLWSHIKYLWSKRNAKMESDFCIAGWMLSPLEEVMEDCSEGRTSQHHAAMDRLLSRLYHRLREHELGELKDKFWTEYEEFSTRTGRFGDARKYIWNSELLRKRNSAKWHAQYSVAFTEVSHICPLLF